MDKTNYLELPAAIYQALCQEAQRRDLAPADFVSLIFNHYAITHNQLAGFDEAMEDAFGTALQSAFAVHRPTLMALAQD